MVYLKYCNSVRNGLNYIFEGSTVIFNGYRKVYYNLDVLIKRLDVIQFIYDDRIIILLVK